ncbi:hypothetical protein PZE19_19000 [Paludisphaera sp. Pla2]|uniref:Uncharacterized protein n=1 Tax=Paludisphaera mucosa TaxID=3030827 RepID=A0ABT6FEB5_9BACT|nr:hypothetical protein [Paludisphaera mucosa]MDG3005879.1 hypothetical protein [Paludisphaera mucosa]
MSLIRPREVERLGHVVVGAEVERLDDVLATTLGRGHDHRQVGCASRLPEDGQDLQAVQVRHHDVQEDQIEGTSRDQVERPSAVLGRRHVVALPLEPPREHVAVQLVVVDDQERAGDVQDHRPRPAAATPAAFALICICKFMG